MSVRRLLMVLLLSFQLHGSTGSPPAAEGASWPCRSRQVTDDFGRPLVTIQCHTLADEEARQDVCSTARGGGGSLELAVLLPASDAYEGSLQRVLPAVVMALRQLRQRRLLLDRTFTLHVRDTRCSSIYAPAHAVQSYFTDRVELLLGPYCDFGLAPVARLVKFWNVPLITAGGFSYDFTKPKTNPENEFYMTTRTGFSFAGIATTISEVLNKFNWRKVLLLFDRDAYESVAGHHTCYLAMSSLIGLLKTNNVSYGTFDLGQNRRFTLRDNLRSKIGLDYGIIILCASPHHVREILMVADDLNMVSSGEYVFFNIKLSTSETKPQRPWLVPEDPPHVNEKARRAYQALITVTARAPDDTRYEQFSDE
ncbi:atrial natriuretic peptide receptor 3-like, partial [Amphibalanus amphitrite]|uniref:atrial natriuretic peptide receptor 3-like n=1 Tax=Amphibalanus amphitrite TaxID=1232801 RepID=UPI001C9029AA